MKKYKELFLVLMLLVMSLPQLAQSQPDSETAVDAAYSENAPSSEAGDALGNGQETAATEGEEGSVAAGEEALVSESDVDAVPAPESVADESADPGQEQMSEADTAPVAADYEPGLIEENEYFLYAPEGLEGGRFYPLIVAFSPGGNGRGLIKDWQGLADKHGCVLFASKIVKNGMNIPAYLKRIVKLIDERIASKYPIKTDCIIAVGTSGGGMASHLFSFFHPDTVAGVISSVGYIHENSLKQFDKYPYNKACVFLTSPTDFNYKLMKEDEKFLKKHDWNTLWIEFEGGHRTGPLELRDEALEWILAQSEVADKLR